MYGCRVFENEVLKIVFGNKRGDVSDMWGKLHNEMIRNFYSSPYGLRMRWAGHVTRLEQMRNAYTILVVKLEETWLHRGSIPKFMGRRSYIKMTFKKKRVNVWSRFNRLRMGSCEDNNESSDFVRAGEFLDQLRACKLLKNFHRLNYVWI
jgi:hypothetical protein